MILDISLLLLFVLATVYSKSIKNGNSGVISVCTIFFVITFCFGFSSQLITEDLQHLSWLYYAVICLINSIMFLILNNIFRVKRALLICTGGLVIYPWLICMMLIESPYTNILYDLYPMTVTLLYLSLIYFSIQPKNSKLKHKRRNEVMDGKSLLNFDTSYNHSLWDTPSQVFNFSRFDYDRTKSVESNIQAARARRRENGGLMKCQK